MRELGNVYSPNDKCLIGRGGRRSPNARMDETQAEVHSSFVNSSFFRTFVIRHSSFPYNSSLRQFVIIPSYQLTKLLSYVRLMQNQ